MREAATSGFTTATAVADTLVELGVPFREAHHIVGSLVARAEAAGLELTAVSDADVIAVLAETSDPRAAELTSDSTVGTRLREAAGLEAALARPDVIGGTAPARVHAELDAAAKRLGISGQAWGPTSDRTARVVP
jgi:argininosuccinate lyase